ncbi:MAG: spore cortex-lytic enzyme [Clostridia bacterium]|nr:spore cortex-lytic enzyme [Clostridia bacterium]
MKRRAFTALLALLLLLPAIYAAAGIGYGARGDDVKKIQQRLKQWGYYSGSVDGVFGSGTLEAVKRFQKKNGLTADGIVGPKTAAAMGLALQSAGAASSGTTSNDVYLLARVIYGEARGEPYKGQVAIGAVVLNRVRSAQFPNTIAGVIYQRGAFDAVSDGQINLAPDQNAVRAARDALNGYDPTGGCLFYYNPKTATSKWMLSRPVLLRIGNHVFC